MIHPPYAAAAYISLMFALTCLVASLFTIWVMTRRRKM